MPSRPDGPYRNRRRWAVVVIPGLAFAVGVAVAAGAANSRGRPFRGVYRQEATDVVAPRAGRLLAIAVKGGATVVPGDRIASLEDVSIAVRLEALTRDRDSLKNELETASRKAEAESALRTAVLEKDRLEARLRYADLLRARLEVQLRREALERGEDAFPVAGGRRPVRPVSSESPALDRRLALADARNHEEVLGVQIAICEDRIGDLERLIGELSSRLERAFEVDRLRNELSAAEARLEELSSAAPGFDVASPAHGRVGVYRRVPGDLVSGGDTIVQVFDAERTFVLLTVPLAEMPRLSPGTKVGVVFEGVTTKKPLSGRVVDVTSEAEVDAESATTPGTLTARVRIAPAGRLWPMIAPGTTAFVTPEG